MDVPAPITIDCHALGSLNYVVVDKRLKAAGFNEFTQFGEDGLIEAVFNQIGINNAWCFEVGASDGVFYSNTLRLRQQGWYAVLAESDLRSFQSLQRHATERVHCVHERVTNLDELLGKFDVPGNFDLGVIDIDGQDYWLWHDMQLYRPRVMLVEFHWEHGDDFIPPRDPADTRQAGKAALIDLGMQKGYVHVASTHVNLVFVQADAWGQIQV